MNIAIVISEYGSESGGLSFACWNFTRMLKDFGHDLTIISSAESVLLPHTDSVIKTISANVYVEEGGYNKELRKHLFFKAHISNVLEELKDKPIDLTIAFGAGENGFFASELSYRLNSQLMLLLRGSDINMSISDMTLRQMNLIALKRSNAVIGLSNELIENSKSIYYDLNIHYDVIPNSILQPLKIDIDINADEIILGCGAYHVNEKKGIANLIKALAELKTKSDRNFKLEIIGNIDEDLYENYKKLIIKLNLEEQIYFLGQYSRDGFRKRMESWDFYIQASFAEGFSNSVGEYLSLGKAFMLTNTGYIAECLGNKFKSVVFDDYQPENISQKIMQLIQTSNLQSLYSDIYETILSRTNEDDIKYRWRMVTSNFGKKQPIRPIGLNILSIVFHDISLEDYSHIDVPLKAFESFVETVSKRGYVLCSSASYFKSHTKSNLIVCTFDDGYENLYNYALPILKKHNFNATVFVCFDNIGKTNDWNYKDTKRRNHLTEAHLLELQSIGWEVGSHGITHNSLLKLTDKELSKEIIRSKEKLSRIFGKIESYAYPFGDFNEYLKNLVAENYYAAYSLTKGGTLLGIDNHQIRRYFLTEILHLL